MLRSWRLAHVVGRGRKPLWRRIYLDVIFLICRRECSGERPALATRWCSLQRVCRNHRWHMRRFLLPSVSGLVLALLAMRLCGGGLEYGRQCLQLWLSSPRPETLRSGVCVVGSVSACLVTRGVVLVALAFSFAISTAVFNTTYNAQSQVDAQLTNGADVAVTGPTASAPSSKLRTLRALPNVAGSPANATPFCLCRN